MNDQRVLMRKNGTMPRQAELALAYAGIARRLRHASRCNCGHGKAREGCTTVHPLPDAVRAIAGIAERARASMNEYRGHRTWDYSGAR